MELKPCPFCGGEAKLKHGFPGRQRQGMRQATVQCKICGCRTVTYRQFAYEPWKEVDEHAIFVWNSRATEEILSNPPLTLDELRELPEKEWVWIESIEPIPHTNGSAYYCKIDAIRPEVMFECGYPGWGTAFRYENYGKAWLAYRRRPEEEEK